MEPLESMTIPPKTFGDGWLTKNAQDLCKIAIAFGGFEADEVVLAIHKIHKGKGLANAKTAGNALQMIYEAQQTPEEKAARAAALRAVLNG